MPVAKDSLEVGDRLYRLSSFNEWRGWYFISSIHQSYFGIRYYVRHCLNSKVFTTVDQGQINKKIEPEFVTTDMAPHT